MHATRRTTSKNDRRNARKPVFETLEERQHFSVYTVTTTADSGNGSLRQAIQSVDDGYDNTIKFNLPASQKVGGKWTITLRQELSSILKPVVIDGTSQPGYTNQPVVEINGSNLGNYTCFDISSTGSSTVEGLAIYGFNSAISSANSNITITHNVITLGQQPNAAIVIDGGNNVAVTYNTISTISVPPSGDYSTGISIDGPSSSDTVSNNTVSNTYWGISFAFGVTNSTISKNTLTECGMGISTDYSSDFNDKVLGNTVTDSTVMGISVDGDGDTVGAAGNGNTVTNTNAVTPSLTTGCGFQIEGQNDTVIGNTSNDNSGYGILLWGAKNATIQGNKLVGDYAGGILIDDFASGNLIGGYSAGQGNVINCSTMGIKFENQLSSEDTIVGNSIAVDNGYQGIAIGATDNQGQAAPVITGGTEYLSGPATLSGTVHSTPNSTVRVEIFGSAVQPADFAPGLVGDEGGTYLGYVDVTTNAQGNATFSDSVTRAFGNMFTATATVQGNTSGFSNAFEPFWIPIVRNPIRIHL